MMIAAKKRIAEGKCKSPMIVATWQSKFGEEQVVAISRNERNVKALIHLKERDMYGVRFSHLLVSRQCGLRKVSDEKATKFEQEIDEDDKFDIGFIATKMEDGVISSMKNTFRGGFYLGEKTEEDILAEQLFSEKKEREAFEILGLSPAENVNFAIER